MANVPVNIVYPIQGGSYPITDPASGALDSAYVSISFGVTCSGGENQLEWGVDSQTWGRAMFYDMFTVDQVVKLSGGRHVLWVRATCGEDEVQFEVGS